MSLVARTPFRRICYPDETGDGGWGLVEVYFGVYFHVAGLGPAA